MFRCIAYLDVPKQKRDRLNLLNKIGTMVGYARERCGYRMYESETGQVLEERSVNFNENNSDERLLNDRDRSGNEYNMLNIPRTET